MSKPLLRRLRSIVCAAVVAGLLTGGSLYALAETPPPLINPAGGAGPIVLTGNSTVDQILDALHARGQGLKDFSTDVSMVETDNLTGDTTTLAGKVWYQAKGPDDGRIRVAFERKLVGEKAEAGFRQEYLLDKGWLIERDYKRKLEVSRQVLKPGQKMNLLKLGEGPFPLPVGQERQEVLKLFVVKKIDAKVDDPSATVHIQLAPKPATQFARKFRTMDFWVDDKNDFPRRIETVDPRQHDTRTTDLGNIAINTGLTDQTFVLEKVQGWTLRSEEMKE